MRRLALFLDGTWNEPDDNTNVSRLHRLVAADNAGVLQQVKYLKGVGTRFGEWIRGGVGGKGLSHNVKVAYGWIVDNYEDGDEIFIFGFSRGAFTARSLAGVIARCGLLKQDATMTVDDIYGRYRQGQGATPLHQLEFDVQDDRPLSPEDQRLFANSRRVDIQFIGVWDTVGTLGVPYGRIPGISRSTLGFHNTYPSKLYKNMYHAVAIDEHRAAFDTTLWTAFEPEGAATFKPLGADQTLEQRWFVGDHGDVGGSGDYALLPLAWIQEKAEESGLAFTTKVEPDPDVILKPHGDSFANFGFGLYRIIKLNRRHRRTIGRPPRATTSMAGRSHTLGETIDASVFQKWQQDPSYRPQNLGEWAERTGTNLSTIDETTGA